MPPEPAAAPGGPATALQADGRLIPLRWHCLRRRLSDPAFLRGNLLAGLAAHAVVEVDLVATRDGDLVCLHDLELDRETTGSGQVALQSSATVLALRQRDNAGRPLDSTVLGLGELVATLRSHTPPGPPDGCIQLDLKVPATGITPEMCRRFAATLDGFGAWFTLSGQDWPAVERLAVATPGIATGFDPEDAIYKGVAAEEIADYCLKIASPARKFYLNQRFVLGCLARGLDPVAPLRTAGRRVDCWTLDPDQAGLPEKLETLVAAGIDQITTNDPETLARLWDRRPSD